MIKQSLTVIAVMAMSVMIGSSMMNAEAVKPQTVGPVVLQECLDEDDGFCHTSYSLICGTEGISGRELISTTTTTWDGNDKYKIVINNVGNLYKTGTGLSVLVGTIDSTITTQGFWDDKGATVKKTQFEVNCVNGEEGIVESTVTVERPSK